MGLAFLYLLFKDAIGGASIGKRLMGLEIVWKKDRETSGLIVSAEMILALTAH